MSAALRDHCQGLFPTPPRALFALDLDGTLLAPDDSIPADSIAALHEAVEAGIALVVATGRRYRIARAPLEGLDLPLILLSHNGALVKDRHSHRTIDFQVFPAQLLPSIWALIEEHGGEPLAHIDGYSRPPEILTAPPRPGGLLERFSRERYGALAAVLPPGQWPSEPVIQLLAFSDADHMRAIHEAIESRFGEAVYAHAMRIPHQEHFVLEVLHPHAGKWPGIARIAAALGLPAARVVTVGDDTNDIPMLREAGLGIAMGNGTPEARAAADVVVASHVAGGVAEAVRAHLLPRLAASTAV